MGCGRQNCIRNHLDRFQWYLGTRIPARLEGLVLQSDSRAVLSKRSCREGFFLAFGSALSYRASSQWDTGLNTGCMYSLVCCFLIYSRELYPRIYIHVDCIPPLSLCLTSYQSAWLGVLL